METTTNPAQIDLVERALAASKEPAVQMAHALWMEATVRHEREPWAVTTATVETLHKEWQARVREAMAP